MIHGRPTIDPRPVSRSVFEIHYARRGFAGGLWALARAACVGGIVFIVAAAYFATAHSR